MAYESRTKPTDEDVLAFLHAVEHPTRRADGLRLVEIFREETEVEPVMWGPSIVGFGRVGYTYATGHSGEMSRVGFSPRKANLVLYGLTLHGTHAGLLDRLGKHKLGKGCLYVTKLADIDEEVLRALVRRGWTDETFTATQPRSTVEPLDAG